MKVLVTGAQMNNKGAQSMLFIVCDELRKRFGDCEILFFTDKDYDQDAYRMTKCPYGYYTRRIAIADGITRKGLFIKSTARDVIKYVLGKRDALWNSNSLVKVAKSLDAIIDISGFAVGDQWSKWTNDSYIDNIRYAQKYNIPIYLMPQSFGPFKYEKSLMYLTHELKECLKYPRIIFAREQQSLDNLKELGIDNAILSYDLVLQNKGIDPDNIFCNSYSISVPEVNGRHSVGIVPNRQCFVYGDKNYILNIYRNIIRILLKAGKKVVIFSHSAEDVQSCRVIKKIFENNKQVELIDREFSCLEYDEYVKTFDFIICSRFHGIVHAYRNGIPAVILGWADKYDALSALLEQSKYSFDIRKNDCETEIKEAVCTMVLNSIRERDVIMQHLKLIQKDNCFDMVENDLRNLKGL